jgi:hypothetical protein
MYRVSRMPLLLLSLDALELQKSACIFAYFYYKKRCHCPLCDTPDRKLCMHNCIGKYVDSNLNLATVRSWEKEPRSV